MSGWGSAIGSAFNAATTAGTNVVNQKMQQKQYSYDTLLANQQFLFDTWQTEQQNKYNTEMANLQNQYNIDMWQRNNEYNSPSAQMQRLKSAGLNPNLMYGQGSTGNSSSPAQMVTPKLTAAGMSAVGRKVPNIEVPELAALGQAFDGIALAKEFAALDQMNIQNDILRDKERKSFFEADLVQVYVVGCLGNVYDLIPTMGFVFYVGKDDDNS